LTFPGTYNFSYYKGDTLEFKVFPRDSSGAIFNLEEYSSESSPVFTISTSRGLSGLEDRVFAFAEVSADNSHLLCVIRPEDGELLKAGTTYVYDIEINKESEPYPIVYTILTGNISITDQVSFDAPGDS